MSFSKECVKSAWYVLDRPMTLGEAPIYRNSDNTLHYVDCISDPCQLHILQLDADGTDSEFPSKDLSIADKSHVNKSKKGLRVIDLADSVTVMYFRENVPKSYVCLYYQGIAFMNEDTGKLDIVKEIIPTSERHIRRFNDGGVDVMGRMWGAEIDVYALARGVKNIDKSKHPELLGRLWRYDPRDGSCTLMETGLACGNGLTWSPDNKTMYLNDSASQVIYAYDFDIESGDLSNRRLFYDARGTLDEPDGMVSDADGNLWIAMFEGSNISVINADGKRIKKIDYPARRMACTTWGGANNNILYSVSAYDKFQRDAGDQGGHIFREVTSVKGSTKNLYQG